VTAGRQSDEGERVASTMGRGGRGAGVALPSMLC